MLHILWMLIKLILILLGTVLGLAALVLVLLLFCPVRYSAEAVKETSSFKEAEATVRISWLFGGLSFRVERSGGENIQEVRILGFPILSFLKKRREKKVAAEKSRSVRNRILPERSAENLLSETETSIFETKISIPEEEKNNLSCSSDPIKEEKEPEPETSDFREKQEGIRSETTNKISVILDKLKAILNKLVQIPSMLRRIPLTIQRIYAKIDWYKQFFDHPRTKEAVNLVLDRSKKLLHHIFPKKIKGQVTFGSEDPSITGTALAVLGMTMPFHKNKVKIIPVFDNQNILKGNIKIKGRIYGFVPVKIQTELYFNKNIKYIISRWKHKEV